MKTLSVALVLDSAPRTWTSQEDIHLRLCEVLRSRGSRITIVFAEPVKDEISNRFREVGASIEVANYGQGRLRFLKQLKAIIKRDEVSLVHVCFFDYFSGVPWLARLCGAKHIIYEQLNSGEFSATAWKKQLLQLRGMLATQPAVKVVAISNYVRDELVKGGVPAEKIIVRYLGVDTARFFPKPEARQAYVTELGILPNEVIVSTVSVLRPFKHPETIVKACGLLAKRSLPFKFLFAGDGAMLSDMQQLAVEVGAADRIHWLGFCSDPKSLLQASDIFVLASTGEAFGLVLTEAMACAVPIVGTRSGAIPELVEDGHTGLLATAGDERSFADAIEKLATNESLRREMGTNGLTRVREKFSVAEDVEATWRIYESVASM
jgi:glycosyltransferase involved in cell wall biosynthesis